MQISGRWMPYSSLPLLRARTEGRILLLPELQ